MLKQEMSTVELTGAIPKSYPKWPWSVTQDPHNIKKLKSKIKINNLVDSIRNDPEVKALQTLIIQSSVHMHKIIG